MQIRMLALTTPVIVTVLNVNSIFISMNNQAEAEKRVHLAAAANTMQLWAWQGTDLQEPHWTGPGAQGRTCPAYWALPQNPSCG